KRLTNRTLVNIPIHTVSNCNEKLIDVIERLRLSLDPAVTDATKAALEEYKRGETVSWESLV
ncbi:MAG: hypothetical protein WA872_14740, partial [Candidatus Sulfotelmatobacter sp.]